MSYIRCLSNPERLYITSDGKQTCIMHNVKKPLSSGKRPNAHGEMLVPTEIFDHACALWAKFGEVSYKGFRAKEQAVEVRTGKAPPAKWDPLTDKRRVEWFIKISYKRTFVYLWQVTWAYVVQNAIANAKIHAEYRSRPLGSKRRVRA